MNKIKLMLTIVFGLLWLTNGLFGQTAQVKQINARQLNEMLQNKDFVLINVHIPFAGDIPQTDLSIPFDKIEANKQQLPDTKDAKIVVYCRSGHMSAIAAKELVKLGYTQVYDLQGGMNAWKEAGFNLISEKEVKKDCQKESTQSCCQKKKNG